MRRLTALCLLACAVVMIGLALAGVLQQIRATRAPSWSSRGDALPALMHNPCALPERDARSPVLGKPSPGFEPAPWEWVLLGQALAWVPQPDWESSPEYLWVPSRVDEHESRATSVIEQARLPD
jgi:hypothetical protein